MVFQIIQFYIFYFLSTNTLRGKSELKRDLTLINMSANFLPMHPLRPAPNRNRFSRTSGCLDLRKLNKILNYIEEICVAVWKKVWNDHKKLGFLKMYGLMAIIRNLITKWVNEKSRTQLYK